MIWTGRCGAFKITSKGGEICVLYTSRIHETDSDLRLVFVAIGDLCVGCWFSEVCIHLYF